MHTPLPMPALTEILLHRHRHEAQSLYALQLAWLCSMQLYLLGGGRDFPMPEPMKLFAQDTAWDKRSAEEIRAEVALRLQGKEMKHGQAV